jgi:hypothetical protein
MKKIQIASIVLLALLLASCGGVTIDFGGGSASAQPAAAPVEVGVDSPANGTTLPMGSVNIAYHASSTDGVAAVELSIDGQVVSSIASPGSNQQVVALQYTWQPTASGSHTIRVRAQNTKEAWSDYAAVMVTIEGSQAPQQPETPPETKPEPTKTPEATETPEGITLFDIKHDKNKFYYASNSCGSHEITISTRVTDPEDIFQVVVFTRFVDRESSAITKWDSGHALSKKDKDTYSITLNSKKITNYNAYEFAVMRYQLVVEDKNGDRSVRSDVKDDILLEVCP